MKELMSYLSFLEFMQVNDNRIKVSVIIIIISAQQVKEFTKLEEHKITTSFNLSRNTQFRNVFFINPKEVTAGLKIGR